MSNFRTCKPAYLEGEEEEEENQPARAVTKSIFLKVQTIFFCWAPEVGQIKKIIFKVPMIF